MQCSQPVGCQLARLSSIRFVRTVSVRSLRSLARSVRRLASSLRSDRSSVGPSVSFGVGASAKRERNGRTDEQIRLTAGVQERNETSGRKEGSKLPERREKEVRPNADAVSEGRGGGGLSSAERERASERASEAVV